MPVSSPLSKTPEKEEYLEGDNVIKKDGGKFKIIYEYVRNNDIIASIDFSDMIVSDKLMEDVGEENMKDEIHNAAAVLINKHLKLEPGDIEVCNNQIIRVLTKDDIDEINKNSAEDDESKKDDEA